MKQTSFTEGKIYAPLIRFALPVLFAVFLQSLYGAVDLLVIGRFSDAANVSAVSTGSQIMLSITFLINSFAMGTTILLGRMLGEGKSSKAGEVVGASILLFMLIGFAITVIMEFAAPGAASLMNAPETAYKQTVSYIRICCGGAVFIVAYNVLGSIFRGIGNAKLPLITVMIAAAFNVIGDLLLVAVFHMGAAGAAYATIVSQALSVILSIVIIKRLRLPFEFTKKSIRFNIPVIKKITSLGFPLALQDVLVSVSFLIILAIVNSLGLTASAGVGIAEKLCAFIMLVPSAFMQAMSAFVAQNYGAARLDRARKALLYSIATSFICGLFLGWLSFFHGELLSSIFTENTAVIAASSSYLKAYAIDCLLTAFLFCFIGYFNGIEKTKFVMINGIIGAFAVRIPAAFLLSCVQPPSLFRIGLATPISTAVQIIICLVYFYYSENKHKDIADGTKI